MRIRLLWHTKKTSSAFEQKSWHKYATREAHVRAGGREAGDAAIPCLVLSARVVVTPSHSCLPGVIGRSEQKSARRAMSGGRRFETHSSAGEDH